MNPYLKKPIEFGPVVVERLISAISPSQYDVALAPDRFTIRELIAHLADWEPILRSRIELIRDHPGSTIVMYDEDQRAVDNDYSSQSIEEALSTWKEERHQTADVIRALDDADLLKPYKHPERSQETLSDLVHFLIGHDLYHIEQLTEYLDR